MPTGGDQRESQPFRFQREEPRAKPGHLVDGTDKPEDIPSCIVENQERRP